MRESFTYLFKDNKWIVKAFTAFIFIAAVTYGGHFCLSNTGKSEFVLPFLYWFPMILVCLISYIVVAGYKVINVKAFREAVSNPVVPFMNLETDFKAGFKYLCALVLFHLCCILVVAVLGFITGFLLYAHTLISLIFMFLYLLVILFYWLYAIFTEFGYIYMFAEAPSFLTFFRIKELFSRIFSHKKQYFIAFGWNILLSLLIFVLYSAVHFLFISKLNSYTLLLVNTFVMAFFGTYKFFVSNRLISESLRDNTPVGE